jgi:hypothetical protein
LPRSSPTTGKLCPRLIKRRKLTEMCVCVCVCVVTRQGVGRDATAGDSVRALRQRGRRAIVARLQPLRHVLHLALRSASSQVRLLFGPHPTTTRERSISNSLCSPLYNRPTPGGSMIHKPSATKVPRPTAHAHTAHRTHARTHARTHTTATER